MLTEVVACQEQTSCDWSASNSKSQDQFLLLPLIHVEQMQVSDAVASIYTCIHTPELLCNFAKTLLGEGSFSLQVDPSDSTRNSLVLLLLLTKEIFKVNWLTHQRYTTWTKSVGHTS